MRFSVSRWSAWRGAPVVVLARTAWRVDPLLSAGLTALIVLASALPAGLALSAGGLVGALSGPSATDAPALPPAVVLLAAALGAIFLLQQVIPPVATAVAEGLGRAVDRSVADRVMAALLRPTGIRHLEHSRTGELVAAINGGAAGAHARDAVVGIVNIAILRVGAVVTALILAAYRWWVPVMLLVAYGFATVLVSRSYQRALASAEGAPARLRRAMYLKDLACTASAAKEVRVFGLADWLIKLYRREWSAAMAETRGERRDTGRVSLVSAVVTLLAQAVTFVLLALDVTAGQLSIGRFTTFAVAATGLLALNMVGPELMNIAVGGGVLRTVTELEEWTATFDERRGGRAVELRHSVVFEQVGFRYPGSDRWVLRGVDLTIPAGGSTAIVGFNGAGKTTLVKLLCGLYPPTEGRIVVDGVDLRDVDTREWQRHCAALFQDWLRWGLSLRDNVLLGAPGHAEDDTALAAVARGAGLVDVADALPAGWSTVLSREFDGVDLSGGQWQRVGLARALWALHAGASVLVLDEPTSALDVRGESELYDLLLTAAVGKTVVLISHRFSTVRRADQIVVLSDGRVHERGDHTTLVAAGGQYASMFAVQAGHFTGRTGR